MASEFQRSLGLELGGARASRTAIAALDYSSRTHRLILSEIHTSPRGDDTQSTDDVLIQELRELSQSVCTGLACHAPTGLPPAFPTQGKRPEECRWLERNWRKLNPRPKPFLPYLQRPAEIWLRYFTPEKFQIPDGLGSNTAPLAARFLYLAPQLPHPIHEVYPRATLSRIISSLGMTKNTLTLYTDLERGVAIRESFLDALFKKLPQIFVYERDLETMVLHVNAFHAFLAAFTQHLIHRRQCEVAPRGFPKKSDWIHIPKNPLNWDEIF